MNKFQKLIEFTTEDLLEQISLGKIDYKFFIDYTIKRDKVYNQLIDELDDLNNELINLKKDLKSLQEELQATIECSDFWNDKYNELKCNE